MPQNERQPSHVGTVFGKVSILGGMLLLTVAALSVPFVYPSETLWYKVGLDKVLLRTGQCVGLLTAVLLTIQVLLAQRPQFLVRAFGGAMLLRWHRTNGMMVVGTALAHVLLVLAPEGLANLPLGWRYWPEMVGAVALLALLTTVVLSHFRSRLQLRYQRWQMVHRTLGYLIVLLLALHVLFVSASFSAGLPRMGLVTVVFLLVYSAARSWMIRRARQAQPSTTHV